MKSMPKWNATFAKELQWDPILMPRTSPCPSRTASSRSQASPRVTRTGWKRNWPPSVSPVFLRLPITLDGAVVAILEEHCREHHLQDQGGIGRHQHLQREAIGAALGNPTQDSGGVQAERRSEAILKGMAAPGSNARKPSAWRGRRRVSPGR